MDKVYEFEAGKHGWNTFEIGVADDKIVIRDESGRIELDDGDVDQLVEGIDQARRRLREDRRRPTQANAEE